MNLTSPSLCQQKKGLTSASPDFVETLAAIDRSAFAGLKRYFRIFAALGANRGVHLAGPHAATHALGFPCLSAGGAALGLVGVTLGLKELLLRCGKGERSPTIGTLKCLVLKNHG
jgi:hypothetical protein